MVYLKIATNLSHHKSCVAIPRTLNSTILCVFWESHMNVKGKKTLASVTLATPLNHVQQSLYGNHPNESLVNSRSLQ